MEYTISMGDDGDETVGDGRTNEETRTVQDDDEPPQRDATGRNQIVDEIADLMAKLYLDDGKNDGRKADGKEQANEAAGGEEALDK